MGIKQLYNDNLRKLPNEYGDVSVMSSETDIGDYESGYEYPFGETTETSCETEACLQLAVPNVEI